ncbi:MAG: hypothetical protein HQ593_06450 [Candidatus Omnitrophica bacterium]|nr:hypothetical protein [Candidatus Omnitrophota bacterium]
MTLLETNDKDLKRSYHRSNGPQANGQTVGELLANTYMPSSELATKTLQTRSTKTRNFLLFFATLTTIILAVALVFLSLNRVDVRIKVAPTAEYYDSQTVSKTVPPIDSPSPSARENFDPNMYFNPFQDQPLGRFSYFGAAEGVCKWADGTLTLVNGGSSGWASACLDMSKPTDLSSGFISFVVRGKEGQEGLHIFLRDVYGKNSLAIRPSGGRLLSGWQKIRISPSQIKGTIDLTHISQARFEFGSITTQNKMGTTLYIKDIEVAEGRDIL